MRKGRTDVISIPPFVFIKLINMGEAKYTFVTEDGVRINRGDEFYWIRVKDGKLYEPLFSFGEYDWSNGKKRSKSDCYKSFKSKDKLMNFIKSQLAENDLDENDNFFMAGFNKKIGAEN